MNLLEKTDEEILEIADPLWDELVESSNKKDYLGFITVSYTHLTLPTILLV